MADEKLFHLSITTPDRVFYEGDVKMLELYTTEGQLGVMKNHIPLTCVLSPGPCYIHEENEVKVCALHSGFVEILQDSVSILAEAVEWPEEIDVERAKEAQIRAQRFLSEDPKVANISRATLALKRSVARIEVSQK